MVLKSSQSWIIGLLAGMMALGIHLLAAPDWIERWYSHGLFFIFRWLLDHTIGLLFFPFFYVLSALILWWLYKRGKAIVRQPRKAKTWWSLGKQILSVAGWVMFVFYLFWGFNYDRVQLADRLSWQPGAIDSASFMTEATTQTRILAEVRIQAGDSMKRGLLQDNYRLLEEVIRNEALKLADSLDYTAKSSLRCRRLYPSGILLRFGTAGFYNPFSGECNIDNGLHMLQVPFIMAHEFFHGLGVTGEGDCNFLAYMLCRKSKHAYIRYSGELAYWRYLRGSMYRLDKQKYLEAVEELPAQVIADLRDIETQLARFPDIAPRLRDSLYSAYLRSNKIHDGMANYGRIVAMVMGWKANQYQL